MFEGGRLKEEVMFDGGGLKEDVVSLRERI